MADALADGAAAAGTADAAPDVAVGDQAACRDGDGGGEDAALDGFAGPGSTGSSKARR